ncbi:hypothetical protein J6590_017555 [Homalodisca vitripennis]|nr:hypothetical protein J6590_017555 [Homalodisca vitripennis]
MVRTTLTEVVNVLTVHMQHLPSELLVKSADLSMVLEEPRSNPPRLPLFVIDLIVDIHDLKLNPSCAEFLESFQTLMTDFESVVLNIPVFLSDVFFDPFTEPMVCGKQEERLCGLGPSLEYVIKEDKEIQDMKLKVIKSFLDNFKCVHLYIEHFKDIHNFYIQDKLLDTAVITEETGCNKTLYSTLGCCSMDQEEQHPKKLNATNDLERLREMLVKYHSEKEAVNFVTEFQPMGILYVVITEFKNETLPVPSNLLDIVEYTLPKIGRNRITALTEEAEYAYDYLEIEPKSTQHYVQYLEFLDSVTARVDEMDNELEYCKDLYDLIEEYQIAVSPDDTNAYFTFGDKLTSLHNLVDKLQADRYKIVEKFNDQISKDISALIEEVAGIRDEALQSWLVDAETNPELAQTTLSQLFDQLVECQKRAANFRENQKKFKVDVTRFEILDEAVADVKLRQLLWESVEAWAKYTEDWFKNEFNTLSPEDLNQTVARFMKYVVQFEKGLPENLIVPALRDKVEVMRNKLPVITTLRNPNLKARHWLTIEHVLNTKFSPEVPITLEMLEKLGVFDLPTELQEISGQASSEASLEALLHKVEEAWRSLELIVLCHKDSKDVFILGSTEEVQTILDESNININTIASSRHVGPIKSRVDDWMKQLDLFSKTLVTVFSIVQIDIEELWQGSCKIQQFSKLICLSTCISIQNLLGCSHGVCSQDLLHECSKAIR